jgi:hypothetical protein
MGWLLFAQCGTSNAPAAYHATVIAQAGCDPNTWSIEFIGSELPVDCMLTAASSQPANICRKNAYVRNLPLFLRKAGKKIKFSNWKDQGILCLSLSYASHHIDVFDVAAE